jgi:hypothetical protein
MKTIREHIESLPKMLRDKAIKVIWRPKLDYSSVNASWAIAQLPKWQETPQGFYFWQYACENKMHALYSIKAVSGAYKKLFVVNIPVLDSPEKWMKQHYPGFRIVETHNEALIW